MADKGTPEHGQGAGASILLENARLAAKHGDFTFLKHPLVDTPAPHRALFAGGDFSFRRLLRYVV